MAYTTLVSGTTITAAWANANVRDQTIAPMADAAARTSAISAPVDGMISVLTTTDRVDVYNGTSWSAVVAPSNGAFTAFTPVLTQSGAVTFTTTNSAYIRVGRQVSWRFTLTVTGTGVAANLVTVSLPANINYVGDHGSCGYFQIFDTSAPNTYIGAAVPAAAGTIKGQVGTNAGGTAPVFYGTTTFTAALAVGDIISGNVSYEAATDA